MCTKQSSSDVVWSPSVSALYFAPPQPVPHFFSHITPTVKPTGMQVQRIFCIYWVKLKLKVYKGVTDKQKKWQNIFEKLNSNKENGK
jgi:hypothetical protein